MAIEFEVETLRGRERDKRERIVVRLQDELDRMIKMFSACRESLENEMLEGMGYKNLALTPVVLKKAKELAAMMGSVVEAKIRFDKAQKQLTESMTPDEERKAVLSYIDSLTPEDRQALMTEVQRRRVRKGEVTRTPREGADGNPDPTE
jgi:hypothetical protein